MKKWLIVVLICGLTACTPSAMIEKFTDKEKVQIARAYIQRLVDGDVASLAAELDPALRTGQEVDQLQAMRALIPPGPPTVTETVGYVVNYTTSGDRYNVTFQFGYGAKWLVVNAAWREGPHASRVITGMRAVPMDRSLQETNAFTFRRAGPVHYLMLAAAVLIPAFVLTTLIVCIRTPFPRRKWVWIIFVLLGLVKFSLNWTTGETAIQPIAFLLFGSAAMTTGFYTPWILSVSFPLGAVLFWFKRRQLQQMPAVGTAKGGEEGAGRKTET